MNIVFSDIGMTTDVTLISVGNMSASTKDIYTLFNSLAEAGVDVDMISQPASWGSDISLSFTVDDHALSDVVLVLGALKKRYPNIRTDINSGNFKLHFTAEEMLGKPGVAAHILGLFCEADIAVKIDVYKRQENHSGDRHQEHNAYKNHIFIMCYCSQAGL